MFFFGFSNSSLGRSEGLIKNSFHIGVTMEPCHHFSIGELSLLLETRADGEAGRVAEHPSVFIVVGVPVLDATTGRKEQRKADLAPNAGVRDCCRREHRLTSRRCFCLALVWICRVFFQNVSAFVSTFQYADGRISDAVVGETA